MLPPPALQPLGRVKRGAEGRAATDKRHGGGLHATPSTAVAYLFLPTPVAGMPDAHVPATTLTPSPPTAHQLVLQGNRLRTRSSGRLQYSCCNRRGRTSQDFNAYGVRAFQPFQDHEGNPSNVGPIFHLTPSGGATCGSLNGKTILGAPYPKRRDGLCYMNHRMPSGRLNDRVYVGGSDEAPI